MKALPYILPLLCAGLWPIGCSTDEAALGDNATLGGTITGWNQGSAGVAASVLTGPFDPPLTTGTVDPSGRFNITLPSFDMLGPYLADIGVSTTMGSCTNKPMSDPNGLKAALLILRLKGGGVDDATLASATYDLHGAPPAGGLYWNFIYADRDAHISGQANCDNQVDTVTIANYDLDLKTGWNSSLVHVDQYAQDPSGNFTLITENTAGAVPGSANWQVVSLPF